MMKRVLLLLCFFFLSAYPIYKNYADGEAVATYQIYKGIIEKRAKFFNPWQYRILSPLIIAGAKQVYDVTIDKIFPITGIIKYLHFHSDSGFTPDNLEFIRELKDPDIAKYLIVFLIFRFIENFFILLFSFYLLRHFIRNRWLIILGLVLISWSMGNGVTVSPLSFDTYLDVCLYLLAGCIIVYTKNPWYILPVTVVGAFNRETSLLIPFLLFVSSIQFNGSVTFKALFKRDALPSRKIFLISSLAFLSYLAIFMGIRIYFGYRPPTVWRAPIGIPMLELNTVSAAAIKGYFELLGVFSILPLICLYKFRCCSPLLRVWFCSIVPVWFLVHFLSAPTYQGRLFLVPTFLVFVPMVLEIIDRNGNQGNKAGDKSLASIAQYRSE